MGADNPGWVPPQAGTARALPVALTRIDQARARKHDADLSNRVTDQAFGLSGRAVVPDDDRAAECPKLPDSGAPAREQVIDLAGAEDAGIGTVILIRGHESACEDRGIVQASEVPGAG